MVPEPGGKFVAHCTYQKLDSLFEAKKIRSARAGPKALGNLVLKNTAIYFGRPFCTKPKRSAFVRRSTFKAEAG